MLVLGAIVAVDLVVSGHDAHGSRNADRSLEGLEIDFTQGALVNLGVDASAVGLLVVHGEMLDAGGCTCILHAADIADCKCGRQDGILAEVFIAAAADRQALDVDGRPKHDVLAAQAGFLAYAVTAGIGHVRRPCGRKRRSRREIGGGVGLPALGPEAIADFLADAERTVGVLDVLDAEAGDSFGGHDGLAVEHLHLLLQRHLGDDPVDLLVIDREPVLRGLRARARDSKKGEAEDFQNVLVHVYRLDSCFRSRIYLYIS